MGLFASPNRAGIMNSLPAAPPRRRGRMSATFQNSAMVLSIGIFFTLMVVGLAATLPGDGHGLTAQGVPPADAQRVAAPAAGRRPVRLVPGYNPIGQLLGPAAAPPAGGERRVPDRPRLLPVADLRPVRDGLDVAFDFAIVACLIAAGASWLRGGKYVHDMEPHVIPVESLDGELALPAEGD